MASEASPWARGLRNRGRAELKIGEAKAQIKFSLGIQPVELFFLLTQRLCVGLK